MSALSRINALLQSRKSEIDRYQARIDAAPNDRLKAYWTGKHEQAVEDFAELTALHSHMLIDKNEELIKKLRAV